MTEVPPFIGEFSDDDSDWVIENGFQRKYGAREVIIQEGVMPAYVFVILEGAVRVTSRSMPLLDRLLGPGELAGEFSYVNKKPPGASVHAEEDCTVFCIPRGELDRKIAGDAGFESRFNRIVSQFSVARLTAWQNDKHGAGKIPSGDPAATVRVWELIEKMLQGEFPAADAGSSPPDRGQEKDDEEDDRKPDPPGRRPPPSKPPRRRWGSR